MLLFYFTNSATLFMIPRSQNLDIFTCMYGVRQGDNLSPSLFSLYINDFARAINDLNVGVPLLNTSVSILLYADDVVLVAESEANLQSMLNYYKIGASSGVYF